MNQIEPNSQDIKTGVEKTGKKVEERPERQRLSKPELEKRGKDPQEKQDKCSAKAETTSTVKDE